MTRQVPGQIQTGDVGPPNALQRLIAEHLADTHESIAEVAVRGGLSRQTVSALAHRNGPRSMPRPDTLDKLARGLGVSPEVVRQAAHEAAYGASNGDAMDPRSAVLMDLASDLSLGALDVLLATARALRSQETRA